MDSPSDEDLTGLSRVVGHRLTDDGDAAIGPFYVAFSLRFKEGVLLIEADPDTDSIELSIGPGPELRHQDDRLPLAEDLTHAEPWATHIGADIGWRWLLTNQNGYPDGFQMELRQGSSSVTCQWMVWASQVHYVMFRGTADLVA